MLDSHTVLFSYVVSNAICAIVMGMLWRQNRGRFDGVNLWLVHFVLSFVAILLIALRGFVSDFASIVVSNGLFVGGAMLLNIGLERFIGKPGPQRHNVLVLAVFLMAHWYFAFVAPSLAARNVNLSLAVVAVYAQGAWIILRRVDDSMRLAARLTAGILIAFVANSVVRGGLNATSPPQEDLFQSHLYDTLTVMAYQMLHVSLTFSLYLMANRRLLAELERDLQERTRLATTDTLTGLANRARFMSRAAQELARTARYGGPLSVLMLDIDHFKVVNDTHGHQAGDHVLESLGRLLREALRDIDLAGRVGGEEFAVLLPQTNLVHAVEAAERLRLKVAAMEVPLEHGLPLRITISIGVASHAGDGINLDTLLSQADTALYDAKHAGRDRVCAYGDAPVA